MNRIVVVLLVFVLLTGCVTITKEYISEVPVEKQIEIPLKETVTMVKYEQANVFAQQPGIVEIALINSPTPSTIAESIITNIHKYITTIPDLNSKFAIYDEATLKTLLNLETIQVTSESDLQTLKKNDVDFVLYISDTSALGDKFILNIIELSQIDIHQKIEFRNSYESTFLNDLKFFLLQQEVPVYYDKEIVTGTTYKTEIEMEQRTITHDFKALPWGGRILLLLGIAGIIFVFTQQ